MVIAILTYFFFSCCCAFVLDDICTAGGNPFTNRERWMLFFLAPVFWVIIIFQIIQEYAQGSR